MNEIIVIKVGTAVLTRDNGSLDGPALVRLVTAVAELKMSGYNCVMVSSGAVGAGLKDLDLDAYPADVETRQAAAAIGQARLMHVYQNLFGHFNFAVAQLLLTSSDLKENRQRVAATMRRLLAEGDVIPIVNENDSVAVEELRVGDNDVLSARLAKFLGAKQLILFTSVDGLLDKDGELIEMVEKVEEKMDMVRQGSGKFSIGGMASKLQAVKFATEAGIEVLIANGHKPGQLHDLVHGKGRCTRFPTSNRPPQDPLEA